MKKKLPCMYYKSGDCSKGNYCPYSHDSVPLCTGFANGSCRFGQGCAYRHSLGKGRGTSVSSQLHHVARQLPISTPSTASTRALDRRLNDEEKEDKGKADLPPPPTTAAAAALDWGFDEGESRDDGVYFYGAPGASFQHDGDDRDNRDKEIKKAAGTSSYAKMVYENLDRSEIVVMADPRVVRPKQICPFYVAGSCKFGSRCRDVHDSDAPKEQITPNRVEGSHSANGGSRPECGICMSVPAAGIVGRKGAYGVMSSCNCVFCLPCIREWRQEGIAIARDSAQVRLCPLCRVESYFVVPSPRPVFGEVKTQLIEGYKQSVATKPCRNYVLGEPDSCPFGPACFYRHDGQSTENRLTMMYDASADVRVKKKGPQLGDFFVGLR